MNKEIYFCNKKSILLDNNEVIELIKQIKFKLKFNFNEQKILNVNNIKECIEYLNKNPYLVSFDIKHTKMLLYLTTLNRKKYCLFIDYTDINKLKIYSVKLRFNSELYKGTLFNGELVINEKKTWIYLITDLYYEENICKINNKFSDKIQNISNILKNKYKYDDFMNVCHIQLKSYFLYNHFEIIYNKKINEKLIEYNIMLIPEYFNMSKLLINLIKTKKDNIENGNNIFEIKKTDMPDVYKLYQNNKFNSIACISKLETSLLIRNLFKNNKNKIIVKCNYSDYFNAWIPIKQIII